MGSRRMNVSTAPVGEYLVLSTYLSSSRMRPARHKRLGTIKVLGQLPRIVVCLTHGFLELRKVVTFFFGNVLLQNGPEILELGHIVGALGTGVLKVFEELLDLGLIGEYGCV